MHGEKSARQALFSYNFIKAEYVNKTLNVTTLFVT